MIFKVVEEPMSLQKELTDLINRASAENESNTPDFVLAAFLLDCLAAFNKAQSARSRWYGIKNMPSFGNKVEIRKGIAHISKAVKRGWMDVTLSCGHKTQVRDNSIAKLKTLICTECTKDANVVNQNSSKSKTKFNRGSE